MPAGAPFPEQWLLLAATATLFAVMLDLGLGVAVADFRRVAHQPALVAKALFSVLVAVPVLALAVARVFDLPRAADIGIVLMAISPGAPVALRRALDAGSDRAFASVLQMLIALLAVVSMPLTIAALDVVYAGHAVVAPGALAKQVFVAQLLPLGAGIAIRRIRPALADHIQPGLARLARALLFVLTVLVLVDIGQVVVDAGPRILLAIATLTVLALAAGEAMGGPDPGTRSAVAVCSALRNPGLALVVATANDAPPAIVAAVFAYLVVSGFIVLAYVARRRRAARARGT